ERPRHRQGWLSAAMARFEIAAVTTASRGPGISRAAPAVTRAKGKTRQDARRKARKRPGVERQQAGGLQTPAVPSESEIAPPMVRAMLQLSPNCGPPALDLRPPNAQNLSERHCGRRDGRTASPAVLGYRYFPCPRLIYPQARCREQSRVCERRP